MILSEIDEGIEFEEKLIPWTFAASQKGHLFKPSLLEMMRNIHAPAKPNGDAKRTSVNFRFRFGSTTLDNRVLSGGEELPVANNDTETGREKNYRVELWLQ